jgi:hypothetical protein
MRAVPRREQATFSALFAAQHVLRRSALVARAKARSRDRIIGGLRAGGPGRTVAVERRQDLSPKEFRSRYRRHGLPVVLAGGSGRSPLKDAWTFEGLRVAHGHETIKLVHRRGLTGDDQTVDVEKADEVRFADFLDAVLAGGSDYMRFSPLLEQFPDLRHDIDFGFFDEMVGNRWGQAFQVFIGGRGTTTSFHNSSIPFFYAMVAGSKRWSLVPNRYLAVMDPPITRFQYNHSDVAVDYGNVDQVPGLDCLDRFEAVLEPGDVLYVPSWMWHGVTNCSPSIGVRCGFVDAPSMLRSSAILSALRLTVKDPNLFRWLWYSYVKTDLPERTDLLLTSRMFTPTTDEHGTPVPAED